MPAGHSQGNSGLVEQINKTIAQTLTTCLEKGEEKKWDQYIKTTERNLNNMTNKATGKTPFMTLHGYNPRSVGMEFKDVTEEWYVRPEDVQETIRLEEQRMKKRFDKKRVKT